MNRKFIKCLFMALAVGLMYTPNTAKANEIVRPMLISEQSPQETVKPIPISIKQPEGITTNKVAFDVVEADKAPEALVKKINVYKDKEGFVYSRDLTTGNLYIAVMRGEKPTGGYGVEVKSVEDVEGRAVVYAQETNPNKYDMLPQIVTNPYTIIKVKTPGYMVNVKNLQGQNYCYYDITRGCPVIGVDSKKVSANKEWTVSLNKEVNEKNVNSSSVYVTDVNGNKVPVKISVIEKNRVIKIAPVESYKSGQTYHLVVTNSIYSNFKGLDMQFTITD